MFATGGQAPFEEYLSSYCAASDCRWAVKAVRSRDITVGEQSQNRADNIQSALSKEFGVEKSAFRLTVNLSLDDDALAQEYAAWDITKGKDGLYLYNGELVRDRLGTITSVTALRKGDSIFDHRTREIGRNYDDN